MAEFHRVTAKEMANTPAMEYDRDFIHRMYLTLKQYEARGKEMKCPKCGHAWEEEE
jgi:hypothetical protein